MNHQAIAAAVTASLAEDVGSGDITVELIPENINVTAKIITREAAVICGSAWVTEVYQQLDNNIEIKWNCEDGDTVEPNTCIAELTGNSRALLTGERCALNWLQTLSGTATKVAKFVDCLKDSKTQLLDTRKTIPGLRYAQKYAVTCGGGKNHRIGLYDAFLIKENHIMSCGSIANAVSQARQLHANKKVEIEVESLNELQQALQAQADIIMLDNFDLNQIHEAVIINQNQAKLEVSGNVSADQLSEIAATGVDYISMGALTKNVQAIDLTMRLVSA